LSIERFGSGGPYEQRVGYSRVVRAGSTVYVAGCTAVGPDGELVGAGDAYLQAQQACANVLAALLQAGLAADALVRTCMDVTDISHWEAVGRAHAEAFGQAPPASAMLEVAGLIDPRMLVEIEAVAYGI
jgi:enamine deaminase RidA (YjgF/YER057c/UK114 family)